LSSAVQDETFSDHYAELQRGDSGSWVVDVTSGEVFGHVVSVDAMGEAFVVPMQATLQNLEERLGVNSAALPTKEQVETYKKPRGSIPKPRLPVNVQTM
jgi:hypothetical protein